MNITLQELENDPRIFSEEQTIIDSYTDTVVNLETEFSYSGFDNGSLNKFFDFRKTVYYNYNPCLDSRPKTLQNNHFSAKISQFFIQFWEI